MKKCFNTIKACIAVWAVSFMVSSCGGFLGFDITDQKEIDDNLRSKISEIVGDDARILEIRLHQGGGETFSKTIVLANVDYLDAEANKVYSKTITLSGKLEGKDNRSIPSRYINNDNNQLKVGLSDTQKLSEIDFSKIASIVNKAGEMVVAQGDEFSGISGYTMKMNSDPAKIEHSFTIQCRLDSRTTTKAGRLATEISYTEYGFKADSEGNVKMIEN